MTVIVPGRFGSPAKRARDQMSNHLAQLTAPYLKDLGWDVVANDLLSIAAGLISTGSDKPAKDLEISAAFLRKYDWKRAKKMMFAAQQGVQPEEISDNAIPGHHPSGADLSKGDKPQEAPSVSLDAGSAEPDGNTSGKESLD